MTAAESLRYERGFLGGLLLHGAVGRYAERILDTDISPGAHRNVYKAILAVFGRGEPVSPFTVAAELARTGQLSAIGGPACLASLISAYAFELSAYHLGRPPKE